MSNKFNVNNKDTRTTSGASIVNLEHISHFILLFNIAEFEKINVGWVWGMLVSDNKFILSCLMGWENLVGYVFSSLFAQHKVANGYIFTTALAKDKSNPEKTERYFKNMILKPCLKQMWTSV